MTISSKEIAYFDKIKDDCKIIFDVGARDDVHYLRMCENKQFHLFEPNPAFYENLLNNVKNIPNRHEIYLNNFGLGSETGIKDYYQDMESFYRRMYLVTSRSVPVKYLMKRFSEYVKEKEIKRIDFMKIDTEGGEPDILCDNKDYIIKKVKRIQFEWATSWIDRGDDIKFTDVYKTYGEWFEFYLLNEKENTFTHNIPDSIMERIPDTAYIDEMDKTMRQGIGFNIIMERK